MLPGERRPLVNAQERTSSPGTAGTRPTPRTAAGPILALDLGASRIRTAVVTADGRILERSEGRTPGARGGQAIIDACRDHLTLIRDRLAPETRASLVGIGISAPGPLNPRTGTLVDPPNVGAGARDLPLAAPIGDALGLPVVMERDTNVAALGELTYGVARGVRDFLYLTVSTGIGGAIVANGSLYGGADGFAGEIGHLPVGIDWPPCGCGGVGHLEATSSGSGIVRQALIAVDEDRSPGLSALVDRVGRAALEARHVADAADAGEIDAAAIMDLARRAFAAALVGLVNTFNPELIVIGGSLAAAQGERLLGPARREVERVAFRVPRATVRIVTAALGGDVGLLGGQPLFALRPAI
jgi:glucokinase